MSTPHANVLKVLDETGCRYVVRHHEASKVPIKSPADFAAALGISQDRITKTLFLTEQSRDPRYALLCCPSTARMDSKAMTDALGYARMEVASPEVLAATLGYPRTGVSPLGADGSIPVLLDESVMRFDSILVGGGAVAVEIELSPSDLRELTAARVGKFTRQG